MLESLPRADSAPDSLPSPSSHDLVPTLLSPVVSQHQGVHAPKRPPTPGLPRKIPPPHALRPALLPCRLFSIPGFSKSLFHRVFMPIYSHRAGTRTGVQITHVCLYTHGCISVHAHTQIEISARTQLISCTWSRRPQTTRGVVPCSCEEPAAES